jgi:hypothetical protein
MTKKKQRQFAFMAVSICGMIFLGVTFLRYVPSLLFRNFIQTLTPPQPPPGELFRGYVLSPIPTSVTNIKADQPKNIGGYRYTFRFNINRGDLAPLTDSRPFVRIWNVKYKNGYLSWRWDNPDGKYGISIPCYDHTREPSWFKPGLWDNPEAYAFYKVGNLINIQAFERDGRNLGGRVTTQLLLYNDKEGEAYFIISSHENK